MKDYLMITGFTLLFSSLAFVGGSAAGLWTPSFFSTLRDREDPAIVAQQPIAESEAIRNNATATSASDSRVSQEQSDLSGVSSNGEPSSEVIKNVPVAKKSDAPQKAINIFERSLDPSSNDGYFEVLAMYDSDGSTSLKSVSVYYLHRFDVAQSLDLNWDLKFVRTGSDPVRGMRYEESPDDLHTPKGIVFWSNGNRLTVYKNNELLFSGIAREITERFSDSKGVSFTLQHSIYGPVLNGLGYTDLVMFRHSNEAFSPLRNSKENLVLSTEYRPADLEQETVTEVVTVTKNGSVIFEGKREE